ncbi:hypothetical protein AVEN_255196-1 [Araneus ventricosus]|uniref:Secreted protein n=1 Tax=Araneus ventricosus TaxID=182803 RepID=A0A4Y2BCG9_ARAVE|nr:hypothetical protein AVEN_255196-1 [Araneus ventricosus]
MSGLLRLSFAISCKPCVATLTVTIVNLVSACPLQGISVHEIRRAIVELAAGSPLDKAGMRCTCSNVRHLTIVQNSELVFASFKTGD